MIMYSAAFCLFGFWILEKTLFPLIILNKIGEKSVFISHD